MKLTAQLIILALIATKVHADDAGQAAANPSALQEKIDRLVEPLIENQAVVGMIVGVRQGDQEAFFSYGRINSESPDKPTPDTVYEIGSISKAFTGVLLADAALRNIIDVDAEVQKYLPAGVTMPILDGAAITITHLTTHTSGLPRMADNWNPPDPKNPHAGYTPEMLRAFLASHKLRRKPGEYEYSNFGVGFLGNIIAEQSGTSYEELLQERICKPLGMVDTCVTLSDALKERLAPPFDADLRPEHNWTFDKWCGCGGIRSTARDLLRLMPVMYAEDDREITKAVHLSMQPRHEMKDKQQIGLGWHIARDRITRWHNGQTGGYSSYAACYPDAKLSVVVLTNTATSYTTAVGEKIVQSALGMEVEPPEVRKKVAVDAETLEKYVGRYWMTPLFVLTVRRHGDQLAVQCTGQQELPVHASSETEFFYRQVDAQITFVADDQGKFTKLVLHQFGKDRNAYRQDLKASSLLGAAKPDATSSAPTDANK